MPPPDSAVTTVPQLPPRIRRAAKSNCEARSNPLALALTPPAVKTLSLLSQSSHPSLRQVFPSPL